MRVIKRTSKFKKNSRIIVFYFPFQTVSGGPIFLSNLAISLSKQTDFVVVYIDYSDGMASQLICNENVIHIKYNDEIIFKVFPDEPILLITPIYWGHRVPILHKESKILFVNWHNLCIPSLKSNLQCDDYQLSKFLQMVSQNNAEFYCDKAHWEAQEEYGVHFKEIFVPITIPDRLFDAKKQLINCSEMNIAVIGRLVPDKIYAITDLLHNISTDVDCSKKINIYIIGDGECRNMLSEWPIPSNINLIFCGTLSIDEIGRTLSKNVDVLFAMGTSVLEGASIGLPSVVIPNDIEPFACNRYAYLYECSGFLLGWGPNQIDELEIITHSLGEIIEDVYQNNGKENIGFKCREYYKKYHYDNYGFFSKALKNTKLKYAEYNKTIDEIRNTVKKKQIENIRLIYEKNKGRNIIVWGAGKGGKELYSTLKKMHLNVKYFIDKNAEVLNTVKNLPVKTINSLDSKNDLVLVSLFTYDNNIVNELKKMGFKKGSTYLYVNFFNY